MPCLATCSYNVETIIKVYSRIMVKHKTMDKLQRLNNTKCDAPSLYILQKWMVLYHLQKYITIWIWCDFDRASSSICGNKMPTRCNRWFLLQILLLAQHVLGTITPNIRSSRALYRWLLPVVFGALVSKLSVWCGPEGYVSSLRAAAACKPDT
jgi:hypothetical protein